MNRKYQVSSERFRVRDRNTIDVVKCGECVLTVGWLAGWEAKGHVKMRCIMLHRHSRRFR